MQISRKVQLDSGKISAKCGEQLRLRYPLYALVRHLLFNDQPTIETLTDMPNQEYDYFDISYLQDSIDSFTEGIEQHFDSVSRSLKDAFRTTSWLPESVKPLPPPPSVQRAPKVPAGYLEASRGWISEHRAVTAAVVAFFGTGAFIIWRRRRSDRAKRRAQRAKNGARTQVVVLAGSPHSPLTRSLSLELERRGFIIYIPVGSLSEEQLVQSESRSDIRPLNLDITSVCFS